MKKLLLVVVAVMCFSCLANEKSIFNIKAIRVEEGVKWVGHGTAWAVDSSKLGYNDGFYIISSGHVVDYRKEFQVHIDGEWRNCELIKHSIEKDKDCALLKVDYKDEKNEIPKIKLKEDVNTILMFDHEKGKVQSKEKVTPRYLYIKATVKSGNSGGPVLDRDGEAIGIIWGYTDFGETGIIIPTATLIEVLKK